MGNRSHTIEYIKQYISEKRPGSILLSEKYQNNKTKLDLICEKKHNFSIRFNDIKNGQWCAECGGTKNLTIEYVKLKIQNLHPKSICNFTEYKNNRSKLNLICENGHDFQMSFSNILKNHWCAECFGNKKLTIEQVKEKIKEKHPGTICNFTEYKNVDTKLDLICENGHNFKINYNDIKQNYWCAQCSGNKKLTIEHVKQQIEKKHPGTICNFTKYINNSTKLNLTCENGHNFQARYSDIQQDKWCPQCLELKSEKYIKSIFEKITGKEFIKVRPKWLVNNKTNKKLELDGFNEELKIAFECQGEQHYKYNKRYHKTKKTFEYQQYKDNLKKELCKTNNIILICVPAIKVKIDNIIYSKEKIEEYIKKELANIIW